MIKSVATSFTSPVPEPESDMASSIDKTMAAPVEEEATQTEGQPGLSSKAQVAEHSMEASAWTAKLQAELKEPEFEAALNSTVFSIGSSGPEVKEMQHEIDEWRAANGMSGIQEDGIFGKATESAVRDFQKASGLNEDGMAGPDTRIRLMIENDPGFQRLDADGQNQIREFSKNWQNDPGKRLALIVMLRYGVLE